MDEYKTIKEVCNITHKTKQTIYGYCNKKDFNKKFVKIINGKKCINQAGINLIGIKPPKSNSSKERKYYSQADQSTDYKTDQEQNNQIKNPESITLGMLAETLSRMQSDNHNLQSKNEELLNIIDKIKEENYNLKIENNNLKSISEPLQDNNETDISQTDQSTDYKTDYHKPWWHFW